MTTECDDNSARDAMELNDQELLTLFSSRPDQAWPCFLDRHTETILRHLRRLGFSGDDAMDRFVYICERLAEDGCRRLRTVTFAGRDGDLAPWLNTVVERLAVNWAWSTDGRRRLLRPIERLHTLDQRVFALHFWQGLPPAAIEERLKAEHTPTELPDVLDALARVLDVLSPNKLWRLVAGLARRRAPASFSIDDYGDSFVAEPAAPGEDAETALLRAESEMQLDQALSVLEPRERLIVQLRFEEALTFKEIGTLLGISARAARSAGDRAIGALRKRLAANAVLSVGKE